MRLRSLTMAGIAGLTILAIAAPIGTAYLRAGTLIVRLANIGGVWQALGGWFEGPFTTDELSIPSRHGPIRARLYRPNRIRRAVVVTPGVHAFGIDEARLVGLAGALARLGVAVVTPESPDLMRYAITARTVDVVEDTATWLSARRDLARDGRVGLVGISFSGGLSIVAAGRPSMHSRVAWVLSFGGHSSLPRVMRFLCVGLEPGRYGPLGGSRLAPGLGDGRTLKPHDYGTAVMLLALAGRVVPIGQAEALRQAILIYLEASCWDLVDKARANELWEASRMAVARLPEPSATLLRYVNDRNVDALGAVLLPYVDHAGVDPDLSPDRSVAPPSPVFVLHGTGDTVIPSAETLALERYLAPRTRVRVLLSNLITHAEVDHPPTAREVLDLVGFFGAVLRQ
ncbi:MAG: hypothetical protein AB1806_14710 [Acidobacteriota bacterium]